VVSLKAQITKKIRDHASENKRDLQRELCHRTNPSKVHGKRKHSGRSRVSARVSLPSDAHRRDDSSTRFQPLSDACANAAFFASTNNARLFSKAVTHSRSPRRKSA
jgi:hypothetical protein